jgi:hypothetical protein
MAYKNKFLVFRTKPAVAGSCFTDTFAQINVSDLNKKGIDKKWNELIEKYPSDNFLSCLTETNNDLREFQDEPSRYTQADA